MSPPHANSDQSLTTRRRAVTLTGVAVATALAGCLGDDGDNDDDRPDELAQADGGSDTAAGSDTQSDETDERSDEPKEEESLVGVPVGTLAVGVEPSELSVLQETVAAELGITEHDVRVSTDDTVVEVHDDVSESVLLDALEAADVDTADIEVRSAVTDDTLNVVLDVIEARLKETDVDASVTEHEDRPAVVFDGPDADVDTIDDLLEGQRVEVVVSYPAPDADEPVLETVLTEEDIASVQPAQDGENGPPHVPVMLTDEAAERFATTLTENEFTTEGVGQCTFDGDDDEPDPEEYCILTRVDDEFRYGASLSPSLADVIEEGAFQDNPSFILSAGDFESAQQLELALRTGQLPTELRLDAGE